MNASRSWKMLALFGLSIWMACCALALGSREGDSKACIVDEVGLLQVSQQKVDAHLEKRALVKQNASRHVAGHIQSHHLKHLEMAAGLQIGQASSRSASAHRVQRSEAATTLHANRSTSGKASKPGYDSVFSSGMDTFLRYTFLPICLVCGIGAVTYYIVFSTAGLLEDRFGFDRACTETKQTYDRARARARQQAERDKQEKRDREIAVKAAAATAAAAARASKEWEAQHQRELESQQQEQQNKDTGPAGRPLMSVQNVNLSCSPC